MIGLLVYGVGALAGLLIRIGVTRWATALIAATAFDGFRYQDFSVTNALMVAFLVSVASELFMGRRIRRNRLYAPAMAFLAVATIATVASERSNSTGAFLLSLSALILLACALTHILDDARKLRRLIGALLWMSGVAAVAVLVELGLFHFFGIELKPRHVLVNLQLYYVQSSGLFKSNALAAFHLVPGAAVAAFLRTQSTQRRERGVLAAYLALVVSALIATMARAALVTVVLLILLLLVQAARRPGPKRIPAVLLVVGVVVFCIPAFLSFIIGFNLKAVVSRYGLMRGALESIARNPVLGSGPGSRVVAFYPEWEPEDSPVKDVMDEFSPRETHNTLLEITADTGLLGLLLFLAINIILIRSASRKFKRIPPGFTRSALLALVFGLLTTEFFALFDSVLYTKPIWILLGLTGGVLSLARRESRQRLGHAHSPALYT